MKIGLILDLPFLRPNGPANSYHNSMLHCCRSIGQALYLQKHLQAKLQSSSLLGSSPTSGSSQLERALATWNEKPRTVAYRCISEAAKLTQGQNNQSALRSSASRHNKKEKSAASNIFNKSHLCMRLFVTTTRKSGVLFSRQGSLQQSIPSTKATYAMLREH
jgi:hypothetical protein